MEMLCLICEMHLSCL